MRKLVITNDILQGLYANWILLGSHNCDPIYTLRVMDTTLSLLGHLCKRLVPHYIPKKEKKN